MVCGVKDFIFEVVLVLTLPLPSIRTGPQGAEIVKYQNLHMCESNMSELGFFESGISFSKFFWSQTAPIFVQRRLKRKTFMFTRLGTVMILLFTEIQDSGMDLECFCLVNLRISINWYINGNNFFESNQYFWLNLTFVIF